MIECLGTHVISTWNGAAGGYYPSIGISTPLRIENEFIIVCMYVGREMRPQLTQSFLANGVILGGKPSQFTDLAPVFWRGEKQKRKKVRGRSMDGAHRVLIAADLQQENAGELANDTRSWNAQKEVRSIETNHDETTAMSSMLWTADLPRQQSLGKMPDSIPSLPYSELSRQETAKSSLSRPFRSFLRYATSRSHIGFTIPSCLPACGFITFLRCCFC